MFSQVFANRGSASAQLHGRADPPTRIRMLLWDMGNKWAVHILLKCILLI